MAKYEKISSLMTSGEAARLLNIHANTLRRWSDNGIINVLRICARGDRRYDREEVIKLVYGLRKYGGDVKKAKEV